MVQTPVDKTYTQLVAELKRLRTLQSISSLLGWDEQINLPAGAVDLRAEQLAAYGELVHREKTAPKIGRLLDALEAAEGLDADRRRVVELARRDYDQAVRLPRKFVKKKAENDSRSYHAWAKARTGGTFADFEELLLFA